MNAYMFSHTHSLFSHISVSPFPSSCPLTLQFLYPNFAVILLYFDRELALLVGAVGHLPRLEALVSACLAYIITPAAVIVCSRHMAFEYYLRSRAMVKSNAQLLKQQLRTERLVHSLVPSFKVGAFTRIMST